MSIVSWTRLLLCTNVLTAAMADVKQRYETRFLQAADLRTYPSYTLISNV